MRRSFYWLLGWMTWKFGRRMLRRKLRIAGR
jgi:hypothetical protein